ncbi:Biopolymer transport protein ExbD [Ekhidna lutea]|uniref:Biopolymer transport protein ExbD n=1 Tax=Ekhidna lutea TaxID=447679 RepID=A0A239HJ31_EKHLU|nr:biopolymer transporter ExbD [Ekhidna lutea]SNS81141.1 Biopolymer transport protein ExbD [Ekhidna lutea]
MARNKERGTPEVSSGSMADIAFLLLIFFLVTTTIANDKGILMQLPPPPEDDQPEIEFQERNIFKILANSNDQLLVENEPYNKPMSELKEEVKAFVLNFGNPDQEGIDTYNSLPSQMKVKAKQSPESSDHPKKAVVSFKANRGTSYELYIDVLDAVHAAYNEIYGERVGITSKEFLELDQSKDVEKRMYQQARAGIPKAISIAEPDK